MSKTKDTIEDEKEFANKETEASEPKDYNYTDEAKAHLHTFRNKPLLGTSSVVGVLAKNLTWWSAELSAVECLEAGDKIPTIRAEYLEAKVKGKPGIDALQKKYPIFKKARFAHFNDKNDKADKGTDMHELMENYVKECMNSFNGKPYALDSASRGAIDKRLENFIDWSVKEVDKFIWSEIHCYSEGMWVGGISDVGVQLKDGRVGIIDFKSSRDSFDSQFIQVAGYDLQITENGGFTKNGVKIFTLPKPITFYGIIPFGAEEFKVDIRGDVDTLKECFRACVTLYRNTTH
jgi:hypothetical protein